MLSAAIGGAYLCSPQTDEPDRRPSQVAGAALLGVGLTLGSCAVGSSESGGESGELRVYLVWGSDSANSAINAALEIFTEERDIEVARETQAWDGYWDRLATQTAGGNAPDLIMQAGSQIPDYASRNTLLNLTTPKASMWRPSTRVLGSSEPLTTRSTASWPPPTPWDSSPTKPS